MWKLKLPEEGPVDLSPDGGRDSLYSGISGGQ